MNGLKEPLIADDFNDVKAYDEQNNPLSNAIKRALQLDQKPLVFNLTLMIGNNGFKMSNGVKNWIERVDYFLEHGMLGEVNQFNMNIDCKRILEIDFPNKTIRFQGE